MAVAHETATESHTGVTGSASEASFDISVPFTASSKGLLVFTYVLNALNAPDDATSVTIDPAGANTDVPAVSGGRAAVTVGNEDGDCKAWFLGSGLPTTTTTVRVNRTNNTDIMYAVAITVTAAGATEIFTSGIVLQTGVITVTEQSVDDGSPGTNSLRYAGMYGGHNSVAATPAGANSTALLDIDIGTQVALAVRETTAGQGSRSVGIAASAGDDTAAVHLAVREVAAGGGSGVPFANVFHPGMSPGAFSGRFFQTMQGIIPPAAAVTVVFRKTLSRIGTRTGSRQTHNTD